jgi:hypothetical protein
MRRSIRGCLLVAHCLAATSAVAQISPGPAPRQAKNAAYIEVFGNGGDISINVDRALAPGVALRLGYGSWDSERTTDFDRAQKSYTVFPVMLSGLISSGSHHLEIGGGLLFGHASVDSTGAFLTPVSYSETITDLEGLLGYRRQPPAGGFVLRAGITPSIALQGDYPDRGFHFGGGVSVGWSF